MKTAQYQIIIVNLDPTAGSEINKTRPCVVISPDEMNLYLKTLIIAPITSKSKSYPSRSKIMLDKMDCWIVLDQIRTIDRVRIVKTLSRLRNNEIEALKAIIREMLVD